MNVLGNNPTPLNLELPTQPLDQSNAQVAVWQAQVHWETTVGIAPTVVPPEQEQDE
jgi:hypothetical protein